MNAVVATPIAEQRVELKPTREHPRLLIVTRKDSYVHASLLVRSRKAHQSLGWASSYDPKRIWIGTYDGHWWLHIGDGSFAVSETEANKLRDELKLPARPTL